MYFLIGHSDAIAGSTDPLSVLKAQSIAGNGHYLNPSQLSWSLLVFVLFVFEVRRQMNRRLR